MTTTASQASQPKPLESGPQLIFFHVDETRAELLRRLWFILYGASKPSIHVAAKLLVDFGMAHFELLLMELALAKLSLEPDAEEDDTADRYAAFLEAVVQRRVE